MELREFEPVIRRCPVDIIDTEQRAFYAYRPDFTVKVNTPTNPPTAITLEPKEEHRFNWYVVAKCKKCGYLYMVFGIEQYRIKNLPEAAKDEDVNFVLMCCDICYAEEYNFMVADVFINLSSGKGIYLCARHSSEVEKAERRPGSYEELNKRIQGWPAEKEIPKSILIRGEMIALTEYAEHLLRSAYQNGESTKEGLQQNGKPETAAMAYAYLLSRGLISEKSEGFLIKRQKVVITDKGKEAIENLDRLF